MKTALFIVFGIISLATGVYFLWLACCACKSVKKAKRLLSAFQVLSIGVFLSVVAVFIPVYYTGYDFGDEWTILRPLLIAIHNSFRVFILDGEFDIIVDALKDEHLALQLCFSFYSACLYVIAPVLTFGNVLSLFKNIINELHYKMNNSKKHYIMSELNEKSIALAKSIYDKNANAVIVFTDVFEQNEEDDYEILMQARDINAICLKKDISNLDITSKKGDMEIFLIGNDESENVSQAVKITKELNQKNSKYNVKVFVFSTKPSTAYILDSIKYDNLLKHAGEHGYGENCFKLRRIDEKQQLIWNTVPKMKLFDLADRNDKTLSVLIVGFGSYGIEFFKMLVWYCQFEGYKLQINIVDKCGKALEEKNYIKSLIDRACPELLKKNDDAQYDIKIFSGVDALTADIDELVLYDGVDADKLSEAERIRSTNLAFVSLGDDDINIEVAIHLRSLFDRAKGIIASKDIDWKDEAVDIYSIVYDNQKSSILYNEYATDQKSRILKNHKDTPYHIHFVGGLSSQFDYQNIYDADLEECAYQHHISWVEVEKKIYMELHNEEKKKEIETYTSGDDFANSERKKYEQYEYYRRSSIAKELYCREINNTPTLSSATSCLEQAHLQTCQCENCLRRKKNEHMRWNAYTRVIGYVYKDGARADRALLHNNLCAWELLPDLDRDKD